MLRAFREYGPAGFARLGGGFALAVWDPGTRSLYLARDRRGRGCLYWVAAGDAVFVGDRPLPLLEAAGRERRVCPRALGLYLGLGFVPAPDTGFRGVGKVPAGNYVEFRGGRCRVVPFGPEPAGEHGQLEELLAGAADRIAASGSAAVVLFSGGLDSSLVARLLADRTGQVRTLSVCLDGGPDETAHTAAQVARAFGTEHHTWRIPLPTWGKLAEVLAAPDEPLGDTMLVPLQLALARAGGDRLAVTGLGADDVFGGLYEHAALDLWRRGAGLPEADEAWPAKGRAVVGRMLAALRAAADPWDGWVEVVTRMTAEDRRRMAGCADDPVREFVRSWLAGGPFEERARRFAAGVRLPDLTMRVVAAAERATGVAVETPFLDDSVAGFALSLPLDQLVREGVGKQPLRRLMERREPGLRWGQPKLGFSLPLAAVLDRCRGEWARELDDADAFGLDGRAVREWAERFTTTPGPERHRLAVGLWLVLAWVVWCRGKGVAA